ACRFARSSAISVALQLSAQHLRECLGREAELQERLAHVEVLAVVRDLPALELEEAHAPEADLLAGAPRHRIADDVAERPLGRRAAARLDDSVHDPLVVATLPEHPLEHGAERGLTPVLAVEVVAIAGVVRETTHQRADVAPVERLLEVADDAHGVTLLAAPGRRKASFSGGSVGV